MWTSRTSLCFDPMKSKLLLCDTSPNFPQCHACNCVALQHTRGRGSWKRRVRHTAFSGVLPEVRATSAGRGSVAKDWRDRRAACAGLTSPCRSRPSTLARPRLTTPAMAGFRSVPSQDVMVDGSSGRAHTRLLARTRQGLRQTFTRRETLTRPFCQRHTGSWSRHCVEPTILPWRKQTLTSPLSPSHQRFMSVSKHIYPVCIS